MFLRLCRVRTSLSVPFGPGEEMAIIYIQPPKRVKVKWII